MQHIVIVTGGRDYPVDLAPVVYVRLEVCLGMYGPFTLFHGACTPRGSDEMVGADRYADDWARMNANIDLRRRPANWEHSGDRAGPLRNLAMVQEAISLAPVSRIHGLAFPTPQSRGTWNCVRHMRDHHIDVEEWSDQRARQWLYPTGAST